LLYETRAIGRYIAIKYKDQGTQLVPADGDLRAWALFEQAASVEFANFDPYALRILGASLAKMYIFFVFNYKSTRL
jgi:glutathione S-transferase